MPPAMYSVYCKICQWKERGLNLDLAVRTADRHILEQHNIGWSADGKSLPSLIKELKRIAPHLHSDDGRVAIVIEGATIVYDRVGKTWVIVTPLFEITTEGYNIKEEERAEAKRLAEEIKERRKSIIESKQKKAKYVKKYHHYIQKYYKGYFERNSLHTIQNLATSKAIEYSEFMELWTKYISFKVAQETDKPEFKEVREKIEKHRLHVRPVKDLGKLRINYALLCRRCPLKIFCKLSHSARFFPSEDELVLEGCIRLQRRYIDGQRFRAKIAQTLSPSP